MTHLLLVLCLLGSGLFLSTFAGHLRVFNFTGHKVTRDEAFNICNDTEMNLVTVYDKDDAKFVTSFTNTTVFFIWVGLQRKTTEGKPLPLCKAIINAKPQKKNCSEKLPFMCQRDKTVVKKKLNWCLAKQHCREHSLGDLVIYGDKNMTEIIKAGNNGTFWIGGSMIDDWTWNDSSCSTFRDWRETPELNDNEIVFAYVKESKLGGYDSGQEAWTLCSKGEVRIVVIDDRNATWEEALDHCDTHHSGLLQIVTEEDQRAVEQWLSRTGHNGTFWVGLRQSRVFGFWIWKDRMVDYSRWENGTHPEMPLSHPCGVIQSNNYTWRDHNCLHPLPFICEEAIVRLD